MLAIVPISLLAFQEVPEENVVTADPLKMVDVMETLPVIEEKEEELVIEEVPNSIKCNCYAYQKHAYFPNLPSTSEILSSLSDSGDLAVFYYGSSGVNHYAKVVERTDEYIIVDEANFHRCEVGIRKVMLNDPNLIGFYNP